MSRNMNRTQIIETLLLISTSEPDLFTEVLAEMGYIKKDEPETLTLTSSERLGKGKYQF